MSKTYTVITESVTADTRSRSGLSRAAATALARRWSAAVNGDAVVLEGNGRATLDGMLSAPRWSKGKRI